MCKIELFPNTITSSSYKDKRLGFGSARIVYNWSKTRVVKVARKDSIWKNCMSGVSQNKKEIKIYSDIKAQPCLSKIYYYDDKYKWMMVEKVKVFKTELSFFNKISLSPVQLADCIHKKNESYLKKLKVQLDIDSVFYTYKKYKLSFFELIEADHWGITKDNRLVLVDYGV